MRGEIIRLTILNDRDKMLLAAIDNYESGFDENIKEAVSMLRCSETQASNSFEKLKYLRYVKQNPESGRWVLNEDGPWREG